MSNDFWKDMDDYHAFMSCCSDEDSKSGNNGSGSSHGCLPWILAVFGFLWMIGKIAG